MPDRQPDRAARVHRLTRALGGARDEQHRALQLEHALVAGDLDALDRHLDGQHPDTVRDASSGDRRIHYAIGLATPSVVQRLVELGADVDYVADDGFPALVNAIRHYDDADERRAVVRLLIDAGADLERDGLNGWRPLHRAALTEDRQLVRMLLDAGADPHSKTTVDDPWTASEEAEEMGAPRGADAIREWLADR